MPFKNLKMNIDRKKYNERIKLRIGQRIRSNIYILSTFDNDDCFKPLLATSRCIIDTKPNEKKIKR
jgi:hypothetical protein